MASQRLRYESESPRAPSRAVVEGLAAIVRLVPKRYRYRLFAPFHSELREFFSQQRPPEAGPAASPLLEDTLPGTFPLHLRGTFRGDFSMTYDRGDWIVRLTLEPRLLPPVDGPPGSVTVLIKLSQTGKRWSLTYGDEVVRELTRVVTQLSAAERAWLWTLLDDALADYEDHLLETDPEHVQDLQRRRQEQARPLEDVWPELSPPG